MNLYFIPIDNQKLESLKCAVRAHDAITLSDSLNKSVDAVVAHPGSHGHADWKKAQNLNIPVWLPAQLVYQLSRDKQRILVAGTKGRAEIISCISQVLDSCGKVFDIVTPGKVRLTDAPLVIVDGDAVPGNDGNAEFHGYAHHILVITQLGYEPAEAYSSFDDYVKQFDQLADATPKSGSIIYCEEDDLVTVIGGKERADIRSIAYSAYKGSLSSGGALCLLQRLGVTEEQFNISWCP